VLDWTLLSVLVVVSVLVVLSLVVLPVLVLVFASTLVSVVVVAAAPDTRATVAAAPSRLPTPMIVVATRLLRLPSSLDDISATAFLVASRLVGVPMSLL
jgi:hypothetical protein